MSGAISTLVDNARQFLNDLAPKPRGFFMRKVCVLVPHRIHYLLIDQWDTTLVYDEDQDMVELSIPELHQVLARRYGPGSTKEVVVTLESPRLRLIIGALRIIAAPQEVYRRSYRSFGIYLYGRGHNSKGPAALFAHTEVLERASKMQARQLVLS